MAENIGKVIQVSGPAVDVQFEEATMPPIYQALRVTSEGFTVPTPISVILEVQQHLGEGRVRTVAMEGTEGMVRGMKALAGDAQRLVDGRHRRFFKLHVHRGTGDLNYLADVFCHFSAFLKSDLLLVQSLVQLPGIEEQPRNPEPLHTLIRFPA